MAAPRPTWKGVLKIALLQIPVKVFPATESSAGVSLNQLHETCSSRIQQKRVCPKCEREVKNEEVVKGFEFEKGRYVILHEAELDAVTPDSTRVIDLTTFAALAELPLRAIDRAYFLTPDGPDGGPACEAFQLLGPAMTGTIGIGTLAIYGREYLVAVGPLDGALVLYTLHHAGELRTAPAIDARTNLVSHSHEIGLIRQVLGALRGPLNLAAFPDQYQADLRRLIAAKIAGEEIVVPPLPEPAPIVNLRDALTQSLLAVSAAKKTPAKAAMPLVTPASRVARRRRLAS